MKNTVIGNGGNTDAGNGTVEWYDSTGSLIAAIRGVTTMAMDRASQAEQLALTDAQALKLTESLLGRKGIAPVSRDSSGLVDQQALFQRTRRR